MLIDSLVRAHCNARVEQAIVYNVPAWDSNCLQHIPKLIHAGPALRDEVVLRKRIAYLEATLRDANIAFAPESDPELRKEK